jgi:PAS domain S-box-containing protein
MNKTLETLSAENAELHARLAEVEAALRALDQRGAGVQPHQRAQEASKEALRAAHDTFRHLVEHSPFGIYAVDADFRLVQVSAGAQKVFENVRPLIGRDFAEVLRIIWPEPFASEAIGRFRHTLETGEPYHAPSTVERRHDIGEVESYDWKIERVTLPDGRHGVVCHFYDLSERQRYEAALHAKTQQIESLLTSAPLGVAFFDRTHRYLQINEELAAINGIPAAAHLGRPIEELLPANARTIVPVLEQVFETAEAVGNFEVTGETPREPGVRRHWLTGFFPVKDERGEVEMVGTWVAEITERKRAEETLREIEQRQRLALDAAQLGTWRHDLRTDMVELDARARAHYGIDREIVPLAEILQCVPPSDLLLLQQAMTAALDPAVTGPVAIEYRVLQPNGTARWLSIHGIVFFEEEHGAKRPSLGVGTTQDITERKRIEAEREQLLARERRARELAEETNRAKDDWLALVTHELRSPLNAILGHARLLNLRRAELQPELAEFVEVVRRNGERQNELINDLLDTARIMTGKLQLDLGPVNLAGIVQDALDALRPSASAKDLLLLPKLDHRAGVLTGDATRLQQVVWNLLTNAVKFTPTGGRIEVQLRRTQAQVMLAVRDTGQGIAPDFLPHVFERFSQADTSRSRRHGGLGLGLALVKQIVELHGGQIEATSAGVGQGATFTVTLPVRSAEFVRNAETVVTPAQEDHAPLRAPHSARLRGVAVLAIEDEADARELLAALLTQEEASVQTVPSAAAAWPLLTAETRPDVLICDLGLPEEDGFSLLRRLRQWEREHALKPLPALALTSHGSAKDRFQALVAGFQMHVAKPVEPEELLMVAASLTGRLTQE